MRNRLKPVSDARSEPRSLAAQRRRVAAQAFAQCDYQDMMASGWKGTFHEHFRKATRNGSFGWSGVYGTHFFVDPKEHVVAVFMSQTSIQEVLRDFENLVMQSTVN